MQAGANFISNSNLPPFQHSNYLLSNQIQILLEHNNKEILQILESQHAKTQGPTITAALKNDTLKILEDKFGENHDYCRFLVEIFCSPHEKRENIKQEIRMFAGQILKHLVEKKFVRMSERELASSDEIKEKLLSCFKDPKDAGVRKLSS